jgi:hypothetical protein
MDNLFKTRVLTTAINALRPPGRKLFQRYFAPKANWQPTDRLAFDVISGSETVLKNIKVTAPAVIGSKTGRKTITMEAPRLSEKRLLHAAEVNAVRAWGALTTQLMQQKINVELSDLRNKFDRTLEFWAAYALRGKIYDSDLTTILLDYNFAVTHDLTLTSTECWDDDDGLSPVDRIRTWKKVIEVDAGHEIVRWDAWCGFDAMTSLLNHEKTKDIMKYQQGAQLVSEGRIARIAGVDIEEYNSSFVDDTGTRRYFIDPDEFILIGVGEDVFDCPYASVVRDVGSGEGGMSQPGDFFFSDSWVEKDPAGRWILGETRPLPVIRRPEAIIRAKVNAS